MKLVLTGLAALLCLIVAVACSCSRETQKQGLPAYDPRTHGSVLAPGRDLASVAAALGSPETWATNGQFTYHSFYVRPVATNGGVLLGFEVTASNGIVAAVGPIMAIFPDRQPRCVPAADWQDNGAPVEFWLCEDEPVEGLTEMKVLGTDEKVYLRKKLDLSQTDIAEASVSTDARTGVRIAIVWTEQGGTRFAKITEQNIRKIMGIVVGGRLIGAPCMVMPIGAGEDCCFRVNVSTEVAARIAQRMRGK